MAIHGQRRVVDFWTRSDDRECLVLLEATLANGLPQSCTDFDTDAFDIRHIDITDRAAARVWTENWQRILPVMVAARGLVKPSLPEEIERYVASPQSLMAIEREFSTGDPSLVRAAVFELLHRGRIQALELHTESLSFMTRFVAILAKS